MHPEGAKQRVAAPLRGDFTGNLATIRVIARRKLDNLPNRIHHSFKNNDLNNGTGFAMGILI